MAQTILNPEMTPESSRTVFEAINGPPLQLANDGNGVEPPVDVALAFDGDFEEEPDPDHGPDIPLGQPEVPTLLSEQDAADMVERAILSLNSRRFRLMKHVFQHYTRRITPWGVIYVEKP